MPRPLKRRRVHQRGSRLYCLSSSIAAMVSTYSDSILCATEQKSPNLVYHKVCLAGDGGVGKTTLFLRLATGQYLSTVETTIKIDTHKLAHEVDGIDVPLIVHDTVGYEKHSTLTPNYFRGALGIVLMFSVDDFVSLHQLEVQVEEAKRFSHEKCFYVLVGNKSDLLMDFDESHVDELKELLGCSSVFYISAKTGSGVDQLMDFVARHVKEICDENASQGGALQLSEPANSIVIRKTAKKKCC